MVEIDFYPLSVDYIDDYGAGNRGIIRLFGRTLKGDKVCVFDSTFFQYFWVVVEKKELVSNLTERILETKVQENKRLAHVTNVTYHKKNFLGKEVHALKVEVNNPKDASLIRDEIKEMKGIVECLEHDVNFAQRYLIDKKITPLALCHVKGEEVQSDYPVASVINASSIEQKEDTLDKPRILAFDIEVRSERRTPNEEQDPIIMIGFYGENFKKVIVAKKYPNPKDYVEFVNDEADMLVRFNDVVNQYDPDYIVGYFSDGFDFPFIRARAEKYNLKINIGLDGKSVRSSRRGGTQTTRIVGLPHIDIFKFIRRIVSGELNLPAYDLDTVAKHLLGKGKHNVRIEELYKVWDKGGKPIGDYAEYNLIDAERTYQLTEKMLPHLNEFVKLTGLPPEDVSRMSYGQLVESYVMRNIESFNEIAPNRPYRNVVAGREDERIEGGFVYQPEAGVYTDIAVFDFKSLYPTVISVHNICPSTITEQKTDSYKTPDIQIKNKKVNYYFTYKYDGIFPKLIREILVRRNRVKEMLQNNPKDPVLNARQYSLKILANSSYGYFAFAGARWYCKECAAATTAFGRDYVKKLIMKAEKENFKVIYGDTDSVFISLGHGKSMRDADNFLREVNKELPSLMELELEGFYPRGIFVMKKGPTEEGAKKKYALLDEHGEMKVVGFESVRGDWCKIAKEVQRDVLKIILGENDVKKAVKYVREVIEKIQNGKMPIEKMGIKKRLTKDVGDYDNIGPHVHVAKKLIERGEKVGAGSEVVYVVQEGKGSIGERSLPFDEAKSYDAEYYINNQIIPVVERIFSTVGYEKDELTGSHKQKSLGDF